MKGYVVEHSTDGKRFEAIGEVADRQAAADYMMYDNHPAIGITYYQLKMIERSGSYNYSKTVSAVMTGNGEALITAQPNPVNYLLTINVYGTTGGAVSITDVSGRILLKEVVTGNIARIVTRLLAAGSYFVHYTDGTVSKTITVTKR